MATRSTTAARNGISPVSERDEDGLRYRVGAGSGWRSDLWRYLTYEGVRNPQVDLGLPEVTAEMDQ
jgi:hypothetical protein